MSYTIYTKADSPIVIAGSKIVKTFPSGLVLVALEYAVRKGEEDRYASIFQVGNPLSGEISVDSPSISPLYIFPEPEWRDSGDGFTRIFVTAYGRSSLQGPVETNYIFGTYRLTDLQNIVYGIRDSLNGTYTVRRVIPSSESPTFSPPQIATPFVAPAPLYSTPFASGDNTKLRLARFGTTMNNYGSWSEIVDVYIADCEVFLNPLA
jgi:hypothetical protein